MAERILNIDISDAQRKIAALRTVHTDKEMKMLVYRAFRRAASKVKTILKQEIPKEYVVTSGVVGRHIGGGRVSTSGGAGGGPSCVIPIRGHKGSIGGFYGASGGAHGWNNVRFTKGRKIKVRKYKITANIVREDTSTLPSEMKHQGGNPPFRNLGSKLGGVTFTRKGKARFPIAKVVGIAVPQMPMNRAQDAVQENIQTFLIERLEHEHAYLISRCR